jgi:protein-disulfide isomerase
MKISSETKFLVGILISIVTMVTIAMWAFSRPIQPISFSKETLIPKATHQKGNPQAVVYLVEFSDFQCPACGAFAPTVKLLTEKYKDRLLFAYRHFPLPSHAYAKTAAYAAEAAGLQGKFWEAETYLFTNQQKFSETFWTTMATDLSLDTETFLKDMQSDSVKKVVEKDEAQAQLFHLPGTPSFFLNGTLLTDLSTPEDLVRAVEAALQ